MNCGRTDASSVQKLRHKRLRQDNPLLHGLVLQQQLIAREARGQVSHLA